jgi:hypothetical protein
MNIKLFVAIAVTGAGLVGIVENASSAVVCPNGGTLTGPISGGVFVPSGSTCTLNGAKVSGGVRVADGTLQSSNSAISGGLFFENARGTSLICSTRISGGVIAQNIVDGGVVALGEFNAGCAGDTISGGVLFQNNPTGAVEVDSSTVSGGVTFLNNGGSIQEAERSTISGSLSCSGNSNMTSEGHLNTVSGGRLGQCAIGF